MKEEEEEEVGGGGGGEQVRCTAELHFHSSTLDRQLRLLVSVRSGTIQLTSLRDISLLLVQARYAKKKVVVVPG